MWPSLDAASRAFDWANGALILALVVGAVSTVLVVWMGNVKEEYLTREVAAAGERASKADASAATANKSAAAATKDAAKANERAAELEKEAAVARADIAKSNAAAAQANERAAEATQNAAIASARSARVEQAARWRIIEPDMKVTLIASLAKGSGGTVTLSWPANDPESLFLAMQLADVFENADRVVAKSLWKVIFEPRVYSRAIFWGLRIIGPQTGIAESLRTSFTEGGLPYGSAPIPNVINDSPGIMMTGGPPPQALLWVGPKEPLH